MKKRVLAFLMAIALSFAFVTPAFAAGLSTGEQNLLKEFKEEMQYWQTNAKLDTNHINQYYGQAETALTAVDLTDAACSEFSAAIKEIHTMLEGSKTRADLWKHHTEMESLLNNIGAKYYKLHVTVDTTTKNATVTWEINGKQSTAASTASVVKQTGFGLGQTAAVAGVSVAVLVAAYAVARKKQLFVA